MMIEDHHLNAKSFKTLILESPNYRNEQSRNVSLQKTQSHLRTKHHKRLPYLRLRFLLDSGLIGIFAAGLKIGRCRYSRHIILGNCITYDKKIKTLTAPFRKVSN